MNDELQKTTACENEKQYHLGIDLIKIIAMFFVILLHSTSFYSYNVYDSLDITQILAGFGRFLSLSCIPLFLLITGYINKTKEPTKKFYSKLCFYLAEYIACCVVVWIFRIYIGNENISFMDGIEQILNFSMISYSWYMNMFIGLFLIIPFLNLLYKAIENQKQKLILLFVFFIVIVIPSTSSVLEWNYWQVAYPLFYYFVGAYISEYKPKIKKYWLILLIILVGFLQIFITRNSEILKLKTANHGNIFCMIISLSIFLLLYDIKDKNSKGHYLMKNISKLSLSTFLLSYIFDSIFVSLLINNGLFSFKEKFPHLLYLVPLNFFLSLFLAFLVHFVTMFICNLSTKIKTVIYEKNKESQP